jgi:hypothetical protein
MENKEVFDIVGFLKPEIKTVAWQEFNKKDEVVTKSKEFKTAQALEKFMNKLVEKNNFYRILAFEN